MKDWTAKLAGFFRGTGPQLEDTVTTEQAQSAWEHFVTDQVLPAFAELKSSIAQLAYLDGTTIDIQQAPAGERWVRLTWMVAPSPRLLAQLPPSMRTAAPPRTVLTLTIKGDAPDLSAGPAVPQAMTTAWCETRIPTQAGDSSQVFLEQLGDYRSKTVTKKMIQGKLVENYQRHVLGSGR